MAGRFVIDLQRFAKKANVDVKQAIRKITLEAFKRVILRTPVKTGRARANWACTVSTMTTYQIAGFDKSGRKTTIAASNTVNGWECRNAIFLSNNLAYILPLEHGSSTQAPAGMVKLTLAEMESWARSASNVKETLSSIREDRG